jgi:hypothetical protein
LPREGIADSQALRHGSMLYYGQHGTLHHKDNNSEGQYCTSRSKSTARRFWPDRFSTGCMVRRLCAGRNRRRSGPFATERPKPNTKGCSYEVPLGIRRGVLRLSVM